ncbi:ABC transporter ATP-binding protein [Calothrix sp. UHCC 0171]|uniref:ABC transporter ATP-binding protein n=1 Tax=Calothrix sp. UHCC 0171 TaxID=3110245 RepID=UPI002B21DD73|nr:ABC transporter ATP-binding protein [Calothrix sp. UHCC 0171]MEA5574044.1 ABC transporter ATP-binding protein [Calothrix sp. UHCC 0171]
MDNFLKPFNHLLPKYLFNQKKRVASLTFFLLLSIGLQLINPQILGYFIDSIFAGNSSSQLYFLALVFIAVALLNQVFSVISTYLSENLAWLATNALRSDLMIHCLALDFSFYKFRTPGELIERVDGDVNTLSQFFSQLVINIFGNLILLLGILIILYLQDWRAGTCLSIFSFIALSILIKLRSLAIIPWTAYRQFSADFFGFIGEYITGLEDIRGNGAVNYLMHRFYKLLQSWLVVYQKARFTDTILWGTTVGLFTFGNALALGVGTYLWSQKAISIGMVYVLFHYTNLLQEPIEKIRENLEYLQQAEASIYRIQELFKQPIKLDNHNGIKLGDEAVSLEFKNVSFSYESDNKLVLNNISFYLPPNQVLGILGRTGSGKTTITRLLLKFYQPQLGCIYFNNIPSSQISSKELTQRIGIVTQDVQLFHTTVRNNLTFFNPEIEDKKILDTLSELGLTTWLNTLPYGLDTILASDSSGISAGQAQLLAFARVFLKNPSLVILDEASSRLDLKTENNLDTVINKLFTGRTGIIIAHRLQSIQRANHILILENGQVIESGDRQDLANNCQSYFSRLLETRSNQI